MGKEDKRKRAAQQAEAEDDETVDLFREETAETGKAEAEKAADAEEAAKTDADTSENDPNLKEDPKSESGDDSNEETPETEEKDGNDVSQESGKGSEEKSKKKDKRDEKIAELNDKLLRQQAEFINFRNRTEKEKAQMFEVGARSAFEKILPVIDNFERGLATLSEEEKAQPFASGIDKTYRQLMTALTEAGVTPIEAVGQPFDPDLHNAVMHVEDDSVGENIVVEEFQKGYKYRDSVLRHSMVKVAN